MERVRVYVDGFNLYFGLRQRFGRTYHWLDLEALALALLRPAQHLLGRDKLSRSQLPTKVVTANGVELTRPAYWN